MVNLLLAEGLGKPCGPRASHVPAPPSQVSDVRDGPLYTRSRSYARRRQVFAQSGAGRGDEQKWLQPLSSSRPSYVACGVSHVTRSRTLHGKGYLVYRNGAAGPE